MSATLVGFGESSAIAVRNSRSAPVVPFNAGAHTASSKADIAERTRRSRSWVGKYRAILIKDKLIRPADHGYVEFAVPHLGEYLRAL